MTKPLFTCLRIFLRFMCAQVGHSTAVTAGNLVVAHTFPELLRNGTVSSNDLRCSAVLWHNAACENPL